MAPPNKILSHIDREEIIQKLTSGESVRGVEAWLESKYPHKTQSHLRLSSSTLQNFRTEHLNLSGQVLADITDSVFMTKEILKQEVIKQEVQSTKSYQEAINAIATERLDVQRELIEIFHILKIKVELLFNRLTGPGAEFSDKQERALAKHLDQMLQSLEHYKKYVEGHVERSEHSINVNIMSDQISLIRETVREILGDLDPQLSVMFMSRLNEKMRNLTYKTDSIQDIPVKNLHTSVGIE